jgi:hypothetical protein
VWSKSFSRRRKPAITPYGAFALSVKEALSPEAILAVHSEGDASFAEVGRSYPDGFIDVNVGYWKELTGEDD